MTKLKLFLSMLLLTAFSIGQVWAEDEVYKTALFGSSYNGQSVSGYTSTWTATNNGFTVSLANFNNNSNGWNYVKGGRKNNASVATIITSDAIDKAITKVDVTIDAITASKINSIKLYTSSDNSTWTEKGSYTKATGTQSIAVSSPTANLYYKIEFDCASGSSNGLVTVSKVEYYVDNTPSGDDPGQPTVKAVSFDPNGGIIVGTQTISLSQEDSKAIYYTTNGDDPTTNGTLYEEPITINATTTVKAAAKDGETWSSVVSKAFTYFEHAGTEADPYSIADARVAIDLPVSDLSNKYVHGIISQIDSYSSQYKSIQYWISDDGTTTNQLEVYSGKGLNGADFSAVTDLSLGDVVTVKGTLKKYNSTYEFDKNSQIISRVTKELSSIAVKTAPTTLEFAEGAYFNPTGLVITATYDDNSTEDIAYADQADKFSFTPNTSTALTSSNTTITITYGGKSTTQAITITSSVAVTGVSVDPTELSLSVGASETLTATVTPNDASNKNVTWVSSDETVATVEDGVVTAVAVGTATITCKSVMDENQSATCAVTVTKHEATPGTYAFTFNNAFWGTSCSGSGCAESVSKTQNDVSVAFTYSSGTTLYINNSETRAYAGHTLTISVPDGYVITNITGMGGSVSAGGGTLSGSTWTGKSQSVSFGFSGKTTFTDVSVTFAEDVAETVCATPTFSPAAGEYEGTQNVEISCDTENATIYYTMGAEPADPTSSSTKYTGAISVTETTTIKAIAIKEGLDNSEIASATYTIVAGADVVLDFTDNTDWGFPTSSNGVNEESFTKGNYTIKVAGTTGKGYKFDTDHLFIGQNGAYIELPTFNFPVSKVVCLGVGTGSGSVSFNLYDGETAISTPVTSCKVDQTFNIAAEAQESNKTYTIKITNANNARFAGIKIYQGVEAAVKKPTITGTENFLDNTEVSLTTATTGATIYYTTDGTDPKTSGTKKTYSSAFTLDATATVTAIANLGDDWSAVAEKTFTKITALSVADALAFTPSEEKQYVAGVITSITEVSTSYHNATYVISDIADGLASNSMTVYRGKYLNNADFASADQIHLGERVVVYGTIAANENVNQLSQGNYLVSLEAPAVAAPTFTPDGGGFMGTADVTIACTTEGADIYYTLDNSNPSKSSTHYTEPVTITENKTFKAIAYVGNESSLIVTKEFTLTDPMTVADAYDALTTDGLANTAVQGIVYKVDAINGYATYWISDDGTEAAKVLEVYQGKAIDGADFVANGIRVADQVVVFGNLTIYNTTKEFASGSRLLSLQRKTVTELTVSGSPSKIDYKVGDAFSPAGLVATAKFSDNSTAEVAIAGEDWEITPTTFTEVGTNLSVSVKATYDGIQSAAYTVEGLTVKEVPNFAQGDWLLVTNAAELTDGSYVIIAASESNVAMKSYVSGNNCAGQTATKSGNMLEYNANFGIFEIGDYEIDEVTYKTFQDVNDEKYLYYTGSSNTLKSQLSRNGDAAWTISISDGAAVVTSKSASTRVIRYNGGSNNVFACYTGTQDPIALYKYNAPVPKVTYNANAGEKSISDVPAMQRSELVGNDYKVTISTTTPTDDAEVDRFIGWFANPAGTGNQYIAGETYTLTENITLYAKWEVAPLYTVTYQIGGSGTAPATEKHLEGKKVAVTSNTDFVNPGYYFAGWVIKDANNNVLSVDEDNKFKMPAANVTISAQWSREAAQRWAVVTPDDELAINGEYVIASTYTNSQKVTQTFAMGEIVTLGSNDAGKHLLASLSGDFLKGSEEMVAFTLVAGNEEGQYAFKNGDNYLSWSSGNTLTNAQEVNANSSWTIAIGDNNEATVINAATLSSTKKRTLYYNGGSPRFACYESAQSKIKLYKKVATIDVNSTDDIEKTGAEVNGSDISVKQGGKITINSNTENKSVGNVTIANGGELAVSGDKPLKVQNVYLSATMAGGSSSQMTGVLDNLAVTGDVFFDITFGDNANPDKWHAFTVPFPVDALNGIYDLNDNKLTNEVNYAIMDYHGDIRAQGKYGWKKYRGILQPGVFYVMTVDGERTTFRFKKVKDAPVVDESYKIVLHEYPLDGEGSSIDCGTTNSGNNGWNGVGNPNLFYGKVNYKVQVFNPVSYSFEPFTPNETNFVVGTPFFIQATPADDGQYLVMNEASGTAAYAPKRTAAKGIQDLRVNFGNSDYQDRMYISANEDAKNEYETGKDLMKMTMTDKPTVAQIFGKAYGNKLCMVNAPLVNDRAEYALTLYAPEAGKYTISAQEIEGAEVYLLRDGMILWNIAMAPYTLTLEQGNTEHYSLLLQHRTPQIVTDIELSEGVKGANACVQKVIIDNHVYILRGGEMYDVTGKMVK